MMNLNEKLDLVIIIPAYNAKDTIKGTLESIKIQKLPISYAVIIVNDCSDYNYGTFINKYNNFYNIREIKTKVNSGPGVARQLGIDNSNSKYIVFIDSDDSFYDEKSVLKLYNKIEDEKADLVIGNFVYKRDGMVEVKNQDLIWLHGKIYNREFLKKYNIVFNNSQSNEDTGFNRLIHFLNPKFSYLDEIVYVYEENSNSITRKNNREYKFIGLEGFCYNMNWAMDEALKRTIKTDEIISFSLEVLVTLYKYYLELYNNYNVDKIFDWGKKIYNKYLKKYKNEYDIDTIQKKRILILEKEAKITFEKFLNKFEE